MGKDAIQINFSEVERSALSSTDLQLVESAESAMDNAYAPYSGFKVGCSVLLKRGEIVVGNNQENAAYPSGLCAERVALFAAKSAYKDSIDALAVTARGKDGQGANAFSCGNCRQVMMEYASQQDEPIRILMQTEHGKFLVLSDVKELLPFHFNSDSLQ
jgi:cytidine deaminase